MAHIGYTFTAEEICNLRKDLLTWYDCNKRDLPWRQVDADRNRHAYSVWVSEIMLQQTRVATVTDYYKRWMKKWPDIEALSNASEEEVNEVWSGLGYYSRGRRLREGAIKVVKSMNGEIPSNSAELMAQLPGVGRYTASAIASIAFNEACGVLDGNVIRVLCRLRCIGGNSASKEVQNHLWKLTNDVVDPKRPGDFNQAMMELGATVCLPKGPKCSNCPLRSTCNAYKQVKKHKTDEKATLEHAFECPKEKKSVKVKSEQENGITVTDIEDCCDSFLALPHTAPWDPQLGVTNYPRKAAKKSPRSEDIAVLVLELLENSKTSSSRWLIVQRPNTGLLASMWEFPNKPLAPDSLSQNKENKSKKRKHSSSQNEGMSIDQDRATSACEEILSTFVKSEFSCAEMAYVGSFVHVFSHIHQTNHVVHCKLCATAETVSPPMDRNFKLVTAEELKESAISSSVLKVLKLCQESKNKNVNRKVATGGKRKKTGQRTIDTFFARAATKK